MFIPGDDKLLYIAEDSVIDVLSHNRLGAVELLSRALIQEELKATIIMELMYAKARKTQGSEEEEYCKA